MKASFLVTALTAVVFAAVENTRLLLLIRQISSNKSKRILKFTYKLKDTFSLLLKKQGKCNQMNESERCDRRKFNRKS